MQQTPELMETNNRFVCLFFYTRAQWKRLKLNRDLRKLTKEATNFYASLLLDRPAIDSHSALRSLSDHPRKY